MLFVLVLNVLDDDGPARIERIVVYALRGMVSWRNLSDYFGPIPGPAFVEEVRKDCQFFRAAL